MKKLISVILSVILAFTMVSCSNNSGVSSDVNTETNTNLTVNEIEQTCIQMKEAMKPEALMRLIQVCNPKKAIVFCNTKKRVDDLIENLKHNNYKAEALHGDIKQAQRERIMKRMRNGEFQILVATDVVARGIDIQDLELVINYDIPQELEYYVHRIGRTGRNGKDGIAYTFYTGKEKLKLREIEKYANTKIKPGKIPTLKEVDAVKSRKIVDRIEEIIKKQEFKKEDKNVHQKFYKFSKIIIGKNYQG